MNAPDTPSANDGGPAFPSIKRWVTDTDMAGARNFSGVTESQVGMALRDWFAGQALAGILASPTTRASSDSPALAMAAYQVADDMLAARNHKPEGVT